MLEKTSKSSSLRAAASSATAPIDPATTVSHADRIGRIKHDSRGNAVWDWGVTTGVFSQIKSTELLSLLDNPTLALEGESSLGATCDWAGDPYNRR